MARYAILDFLATKNKEIIPMGYMHMTICDFGQVGDDSLLKLFEDDQLIRLYHVKEPRIYEKKISFAQIENTIVEMLFSYPNVQILNYDDIPSSIIDIYYQKKLLDLDFKCLLLIPILKEDDLIGAAVVFFNQKINENPFANKELIKLLNNIFEERITIIENDITRKINNDSICYIVRKNNIYYIDNNIKNYLNINNNYILENNPNNKHIQRLLSRIKFNYFENKDLIIYYQNKSSLDTNVKKPIYSLKSINDHCYNNCYTLIFYKQVNDIINVNDLFQNIINQELIKNLNNYSYNLYDLSNRSFACIISIEIPIKIQKQISNKIFNNYIQFISTKVMPSNKIDLIKLVNYLDNQMPDLFKLSNYINYLNGVNEIRNNSDYSSNIRGLYTSEDLKLIGQINFYPMYKLFDRMIINSLINDCSNNIEIIIKSQTVNNVITIYDSMLKKRKTWESIKKIFSFDSNLKIILYHNCYETIAMNLYEKNIARLKILGIYLIVESSIYLNINYTGITNLFDAILIRKEEFENITQHPTGFTSAALYHFYQNYKDIIIENNNVNSDYRGGQFYYIK